ncbi:MAG: FmdE family protein [Thermodesulfobacteriota bacterium]
MKKICSHSLDEYMEMIKSFHGYLAPGIILGGFMVDLALRHLPDGQLYDALCETPKCLPDAVQLLTPCTVGNGWLRVVNLGRFALTLYEKETGRGVRVFVDPAKLGAWPELKSWFLKLKSKAEQDLDSVVREIIEAGDDTCGLEPVRLKPEFLKKRRRRAFSMCPVCHESFPTDDGPTCLACQGQAPYIP